MAEGEIRPKDIVSIGAGIAGFDRNEDIHWVKSLLEIKGISCPIKFVNDAVIAHIGAFLFAQGIVAICGTGSVILGINEQGKQIRKKLSGRKEKLLFDLRAESGNLTLSTPVKRTS